MTINFLSGLPRSGSTLLAALLRQNPRFSASIESPVCGLYSQVITTLSKHEAGGFASDEKRKAILRAVVGAYYEDAAPNSVVFDNSRGWCAHLAGLKQLYPRAHVLCCVRNPAWVLDSIERLIRRYPFRASRLFDAEAARDVYSRVEFMAHAMVGTSLRRLREAWFSDQADMLILIRYDSLCAQPAQVMRELYARLDEPWFEHDFDNVTFSEPAFDEHLGLPGLHTVAGPITARTRDTLLPSDLFEANSECFWDHVNPRDVAVL